MTASRAALWTTLLAVVCGCQDPLPRPSRVEGLRLLAIVAEPPEAAPGQTVQLTPLVVDTEERPLTYRWAACIVPAFADDDDEAYDTEDCILRQENNEDGVIDLGTGMTASYTVPADVFDDPSVISKVYGFEDTLDKDALTLIAAVIGLDVTVSFHVTAGTETLRSVKRLKVSLSGVPNTNPQPVAWVLRPSPDEQEREAEGFEPEPLPSEYELPEPGRCLVTVDGERPTVSTENGWELVPVNLPDTYENYPVVGVSPNPDEPFQVVDVDEVFVFQFFSTEGSLNFESNSFQEEEPTEPPKALPGTSGWSFESFPEDVDELPLWIVTRDGRGGTVFCDDRVTITQPP